MRITKNNVNRYFGYFLIIHLLVWTLIPGISNNNLPLDTIEALAWGSNLDWGFNKHPPLSGFFVEIFYQIFGNQDWAYYFLSQLFVISTFFVVFKFSENFFNNSIDSLISVLLLEGIFFYNFTTPEFNVNVCQLPFWALSVLFCWRGFEGNKSIDWLLFGLFAGLGFLSKYLFIYLLVAIDIFFLYQIYKKKINYRCFISIIPFLLILLPHLLWLKDNNYITLVYALNRTGVEDGNLLSHLSYPFIFLVKQIGILFPFFLMLLFLIKNIKTSLNLKDKKLIFLFTINIIPIILVFLTSAIMGAKIKTMWMTPFYLFFGVFLVYIYKTQINLNNLKNLILAFSILFILSPITYSYISISQTDKRTDYPGKEIANEIQKQWNKNNFINNIDMVIGDEWHAGNLSYHLDSRPRWYNKIIEEKDLRKIQIDKSGIVAIGDVHKNCKENTLVDAKVICLKINSQYFEIIGNL